MDDGPDALFVYGTLKRGQLNFPLLAPHARAIAPATTRGYLHDLGLYPAMSAGEGTVRGELVRLDPADLPAVLAVIDRLEDYRPDDPAGSMYLRRVVAVELADGGWERAHAYFYNRAAAALPRIAGGEWFPADAPAVGIGDVEREAFDRHVRAFLRGGGGGRGDTAD